MTEKKPQKVHRRAKTRKSATRVVRKKGPVSAHKKTTKKKVARKTTTKKTTRKKTSRRRSNTRNMKRRNVAARNTQKIDKDLFSHIPMLNDGDIRVVPVSGVEEIGRNMAFVEFKDDIIVIDAGVGFSDEETPGIDYVIPNTKYLEANKHRIKGLVITHGHLDHVGGIPYVLEALGNPTIYTREFGALFIKKKLEEFTHLPKANIVTVEADDQAVALGEHMKVKFFGVTHSIPDSTGVLIETPHGDIFFTGDVRVENTDGVPSQKEQDQWAELKDRNILLLAMDSTGMPAPGWSLSEQVVIDTIDDIIKHAPGRLIIGTFASQIERILEFINSAKKHGKYVVFEGRSMVSNVGIAQHLELTDFSHVISAKEMKDYPPHKIVMMVTGAQGEEFAALNRMATKRHKNVTLEPTDTIVLSSSVIPGNEVSVQKMKDNLYRNGVRVITYMDNQVHASGHGKREELAWIHGQVPYKFFMPVHGHYFMLCMHKELAEKLGAAKDEVLIPENGSIIEIRDQGNTITRLDEKVPADPMVVEGTKIGDLQSVVIRDRKMLAEDGIFIVVVALDPRTGKLKKSPDIISRGFVYLRENQALLQDVRNLVKRTVESSAKNMNPINFDHLKDIVNEKASRYLLQKTNKHPIVIPVVLGL
jgi:ribonuclease J